MSRHRFLVAPLDWGLGHATRCMPIIRRLLRHGQEVLIAAQGAPADVLAREFPNLQIVPVAGYDMRYGSGRLGLYLRFPWMTARVLRRARREHRDAERLVREHRIDAVISDNRFGFHTERARCVYMTHQLCVKFPRGFGFLERAVWRRHARFMAGYNEVWIPDLPGEDNLTGDLTRKYPLPSHHRFIGLLSRFEGVEASARHGVAPDVLVLLSGPEPQRTRLEQAVLPQLDRLDATAVVLRGTPGTEVRGEPGERVRTVPHADSAEMLALLSAAGAVVCRGGYTTIMELVALGKKAVLIPTPGQTEQEYLCRRLSARGRFVVCSQERLDLKDALGRLAALPQPVPGSSGDLLDKAVAELVAAL
jgi:UDP:flavonoid glycosyltransferase YjiC (YdhE family)